MSKRAQQLTIIGVLAAVIVVLVVVFSQGSSETSAGPAANSKEVEKRFAGIPQKGVVLGDPNAPETIVEFADLQCPFCGEFAKETLPDLVDKQVRTGKVKLELRLIAIVGDGVQSTTAATAAAAASLQDKLWQFTDLFYLNQGIENTGYVTDDFITSIYDAIPGLDVEQAQADRTSEAAQAVFAEDLALAGEYGVSSTPSLFLKTGNGDPVPIELESFDYASFEQALQAARSK